MRVVEMVLKVNKMSKKRGGDSMGNGVKIVPPETILGLVKTIYGFIRPWLWDEAKKSDSPIDDWMLSMLDRLLGFDK